MSIILTDVLAAIAGYVRQNVTVNVSEVTHGHSSVLHPDESAEFTVTLTNAPGGIRLTGIVYDFEVDPPEAADLLAFGSALMPSRTGLDLSQHPLQEDEPVKRLIVRPAEATGYATLDPGQAGPVFEVCIRTRKAGDAAVSCRIYASIDLASVFPAGQQARTTNRTFTVQ